MASSNPKANVHITEHVTSPTSVTSTASITTSNASTLPITSVTFSTKDTRPTTRSSTTLGASVKSTHMKVRVSPDKSLANTSKLTDNPASPASPSSDDSKKKKKKKEDVPKKDEPKKDELTKRIDVLEASLHHQNLYNLIQNDRVKQLEQRVSSLEGDLMKMNARFAVRDHVIEALKGEVNRLQQFTRRYSVVVSGIEKKKDEKIEDLRAEVQKLVSEVKSTTNEHGIDKLHRNGRVFDGNQDVIIRFKSHAAKEAFYRARKTILPTRREVKIRPALCPAQKQLLRDAKSWVEDFKYEDEVVNPVEFIFANINGDLQAKLQKNVRGSPFVSFNSVEQLAYKLQQAQVVEETDKIYHKISSWADDSVASVYSDSEDDMGFGLYD